MKLFAATLAGVLLFGASFGLLVLAEQATDVAAVAGGTGVVLSAAMLCLTGLAWRWRGGARAYTASLVRDPAFYDELATALDESTDGYDASYRAVN